MLTEPSPDAYYLLRDMQSSSNVHEYDLCLSSMLRATQHLAWLYRKHDTIPTEDGPRTDLLMDCITSERILKAVTDQDITNIVLRWQQMRHLRDLYLEDHITSEFSRFRTDFISNQAFETRAAVVEPGITTTSNTSRSGP